MKRQPGKVSLSRETLRRLDEGRGAGGPVGTYPDTQLPDHCYTASCHGIC
jgi:hypothetical protein